MTSCLSADHNIVLNKTVLTSVEMWSNLRYLSPRISFHVLLDPKESVTIRKMCPDWVHIDVCPNSYQPKVAKYKARVLEWFRIRQILSDDDWVLHLDEETRIDEDLIKTCLNFIERGDEHIGMVSFASFLLAVT